MDDWTYLERRLVTDPNGRQWTVALMDVLGQEGDPDMPGHLLEAQYASGRYFTLVYSASGSIQLEHGHRSLDEATTAYEQLLARTIDGSYDPNQPVFKAKIEDE
jgi:hypothetical protein